MRPCRRLIVVGIFLAMPALTFAGLPDGRKRPVRGATPDGGNAGAGAPRRGEARREHPTPLGRAYLDALSILGKDNTCSRFLGGSSAAEETLGRLAAQMQVGPLRNSRVGIRMSGTFTFYSRPEKGFSYRLFNEARINTGGPFYRAKAFPSDPFIPNVGSFRPNTRGARILMLLHELAHLLVGPDGRWLIPDDANNPEQNGRNTALVESQCGEQILSL